MCSSRIKVGPKAQTSDEGHYQRDRDQLIQQIKQKFGEDARIANGDGGIRMSEVILHLAQDLLAIAKTKSAIDAAIGMTCTAWNLAVLLKPAALKKEFANLYRMVGIDDPQEQKKTRKAIYSIIENKKYHYPNVNRIIVDHKLIGNRINFKLNVISTEVTK